MENKMEGGLCGVGGFSYSCTMTANNRMMLEFIQASTLHVRRNHLMFFRRCMKPKMYVNTVVVRQP